MNYDTHPRRDQPALTPYTPGHTTSCQAAHLMIVDHCVRDERRLQLGGAFNQTITVGTPAHGAAAAAARWPVTHPASRHEQGRRVAAPWWAPLSPAVFLRPRDAGRGEPGQADTGLGRARWGRGGEVEWAAGHDHPGDSKDQKLTR